MKREEYYIGLALLSSIGAAVAKALGGWDAALSTLCAVMAVDFITGVVVAFVWRNSSKTEKGAFDSRECMKGLFKKMAILACVFLAYRLEVLTGSDFIRNGTILFFVANDGFSIVENFGKMGVPMPEMLKGAFEQLNNKKGGE